MLITQFSLMTDDKRKEHPGFPSFVQYVKHRSYSVDDLNRAWEWFKVGWSEGMRNAGY